MYLCLVILRLALSEAGVFLVGAASAALITIAILVMVWKELTSPAGRYFTPRHN
jgi:hypothetical protein